jgi:carbamoyl-phosphate synthase large subunit
MSVKQLTVFIPSGAGAPGFGGIFHCLKQDPNIVVYAGDQNALSYGFGLADFAIQVPSSNHPEYIPFLLNYCSEHQIDVLLPITTRELEPLSENAHLFEQIGTKVIVSQIDGLKIANNKFLVLEHAKKHDIAVPEFKQVFDFRELSEYCNQRFNTGELKQCFKPVNGNGSRGFGVVSRSIDSSFLNEKSAWMPLTLDEWGQRMDPKKFLTPLLVSDFLDGAEYSVDVLVHNGEIRYCIPRKRNKMIGGISVAGVIENNTELIDVTIKLVKSLNLTGPIGVQWKYDLHGIPKLLEINPRLQGTTSACVLAGVNIPLDAIKCATYSEFEPIDSVVWGTTFTRYWMDINLKIN